MPCTPEILRNVPLFAVLDDEETAVLASQVEVKTFAPRQRIYKIGDPGGRAYVLVSGHVQISTVDEDHQDVIVDQPAPGEFFGFASMLDQTAHQTNAVALAESVCIEVDRNDIIVLLTKKPHAGMDMLAVLGRQFHAAQQLVRIRAMRNPNEVIEEKATLGENVADAVDEILDHDFAIPLGDVAVVRRFLINGRTSILQEAGQKSETEIAVTPRSSCR